MKKKISKINKKRWFNAFFITGKRKLIISENVWLKKSKYFMGKKLIHANFLMTTQWNFSQCDHRDAQREKGQWKKWQIFVSRVLSASYSVEPKMKRKNK